MRPGVDSLPTINLEQTESCDTMEERQVALRETYLFSIRLKRAACLSVSLALLLTPSAHATQDEDPARWVYKSFSQEVDGADRDRAVDYDYRGALVYTGDASQPGALFTCSERFGLSVALTTKPVDFEEAFAIQDRRARWRSVTHSLDGSEAETGRWAHLPRVGTIEPKDKSLRRKLYNAVLRGQTVTLKMSGRPEWSVSFPKPDAAFRKFALGCPITNPDTEGVEIVPDEDMIELRSDTGRQ